MTFWSVFSLGWCLLVFARETHALVTGEPYAGRPELGIVLTVFLMLRVAAEREER